MPPAKKAFREFLLLWSGSFICFQLTGKASLMALITLLGFLPSLLLSIPAGVLADRYDRRLLMVIRDSFSAIGLLYILFCMRNNEAHLEGGGVYE